MLRRGFVGLLMAAPFAVACTNKGVEAQKHSAEACDLALEYFSRDVDQIRKGMPEGAKILEKRLPVDPKGMQLETQTALKAARENTKDLAYAKASFFAFTDTDGQVLRMEDESDRLSGKNIFDVYGGLKKALEPNAGLVEAWGEMDALRGVKRGNDTIWIVAHAVNGADGKPRGLFIAGWSLRLYTGNTQAEVRRKIDDKQKDQSAKVELYLFVVKGSGAYGDPEAPETHEKEIVKQDVVSKLGSGEFRTTVENEGTWGITAKKAPQFGDDAAVVVISTLY